MSQMWIQALAKHLYWAFFLNLCKKDSTTMFDKVLNTLLNCFEMLQGLSVWLTFEKLIDLTHLFPMNPFSTRLWFSDVFRDYRKDALGKNGLTYCTENTHRF